MGRQAAKPPRSEPREEIDRLAYTVIGAAIEVHRNLGPGFLETIYEEALARELALRGIPFERQVRIPIVYKGSAIGEHVIDLLVDGELVVELKSVVQRAAVHGAQVHSYLKAGAFEIGLLINFDVPILKEGIRRIILKNEPWV